MGPSLPQLRPVFVLALLFLGLFGATACGGAPETTVSPTGAVTPSTGDRLVLFAHPRLITAAGLDDAAPTSAAAKVQARPYSSGEDILVDLAAGRRADVVEVCSSESAERLARAGLLRPLDTTRIEQWDRLYPVLKDLPGVVVDGQVFMVPVTASLTGVLYDQAVHTPPDSFADVFSGRYKGHLAFADDPALAFQVAALGLGLPDPANLTAEQALQAEIYLKHYKDSYRSFWYDLDNLASAFRRGHVTVAVGDRRDALQLARRGAPVAFALASEGQPLATCGLAITASSHDLDASYALIDHLLEPETQAEIALAADDLVANRDAATMVPSADGARDGLDVLARLDRPVARPSSLEHLEWIQAWYEVKKGRG